MPIWLRMKPHALEEAGKGGDVPAKLTEIARARLENAVLPPLLVLRINRVRSGLWTPPPL